MRRISRRGFIRGASAGVAWAAMRGPAFGAEASRQGRPNVLWIILDDCRADALGCYGRPWPKTPVMDEIAGRGVRFEKAVVQNPVCVPSRASMKSGCYAHKVGIITMGPPGMPAPKPRREDLLLAWKRAGIAPVSIGKVHAYQQDWDQRGDVMPYFDVDGQIRFKKDWAGTPDMERAKRIRSKLEAAGVKYPAAVTKTHGWAIGGEVPVEPEDTETWGLGDLAVDTLSKLIEAGKPFFMRVSFHAPHVPCWVPKGYLIDPAKITLPLPSEEELRSKPRFERENMQVYCGADLTAEQIGIARGTYYGMVSLVDGQVGRLVEILKKAGVLDNTVIAINSDQGFQLGEHGLWKKRCFYEGNVCVPFVMSCPGLLPANRVVDEPVEMVDFVPTLMELCGLDVPGGIDGRSLVPLVKGRLKDWREACFCEHDFADDMYEELRKGGGRGVMVKTKEWKLSEFVEKDLPDKNGSLYDLKNDAAETRNLYAKQEYAEVKERLRGLVKVWDKSA